MKGPDLARAGHWVLRNRVLVRAPVPLFRAGLGFVLGKRLLMLEHTGRRSGVARYVVLEVVKRESATSLVVASGFGQRAQWFRNVKAEARCHVSTGLVRRSPARATTLPTGERDAVLASYRRDHPKAWEVLAAVVTRANQNPDDIPLVRLRLDSQMSSTTGPAR